MGQYYIELNGHYFHSTICKGRALTSESPTAEDWLDSFSTKDPSQAKIFNSEAEASANLDWVAGGRVIEIIPNSGETSKIHREVKL